MKLTKKLSSDAIALKVAILTQQTEKLDNLSIQMLMQALEEKGCKVTLIPFNEGHKLNYGFITIPFYREERSKDGYAVFYKTEQNIAINVRNFDVVIKRTWGYTRLQGLEYYRYFINYGVTGLNDPESIDLSHSKIQMHRFFKEIKLPIPETYVLDHSSLTSTDIDILLSKCQKAFGSLFIVKGEAGTRGDSVRLIDMEQQGRENFWTFFKQYHHKNPDKGIILQEYIQTSTDKYHSHYWRLNLVNGSIQSAVCFKGKFDNTGKLTDVDEEDTPLPVTVEMEKAISPLIKHPYYSKGIWGVDMLHNIHQPESLGYSVLEINDGPNISLMTQIGKTAIYQDQAAAACGMFVKAYAEAITQLNVQQHKARL